MPARQIVDFTITIPVPGEEPLRGKFRVKVKLSYREILEMDALRRQYLGPQSAEADGLANLIASSIAKIQTHSVETPSWWKEAGNGLDFEDVNVIIKVAAELNKVEKSHVDDLQAAAEKAAKELAPKGE